MKGALKNINDLIAALRILENQNKFLDEKSELFEKCEQVFRKLEILRDFDSQNLANTIEILENLPNDTKELEIEKLKKEEIPPEEDRKAPESKLDKMTLNELVAEYEKSKTEAEKKEIASKITQRTGRKNVEDFVRRQREIAQEKAKKTTAELVREYKNATGERKAEIEKEIHVRTGTKETESFVNRFEEVSSKKANELESLGPKARAKITEDVVVICQNKQEKTVGIIEEIIFKEKVETNEIEQKIGRVIEDKEEREKVVERIVQIRAEIVVQRKAEEIANTIVEKLKAENLPVKAEAKEELREEVLRAWREGDKLEIPEELATNTQSETIVKEAVVAVENFKKEELVTVVNYRAIELGKEIGQELRKKGISDENLIEEYARTVNKFTNNPETAREEINTSEAVTAVRQSHDPKYQFPVQPERAVEEAQLVAKNVVMAPKKFNRLIQNYNRLREKIGSDKLPVLKEVRVLEKMTAMFRDSPKALSLLNGAQRMVGVIEKINGFPGNLLVKLGAKDFGIKVLTKIGGQAMGQFITNASTIIAEQGTLQGIKSIALGIMGKGAVAAGAGTGALAGAVAAFQAIPVVGQIVLVAAATLMILKPIINGIKNGVGKVLHIDLNGAKKFIAEDLGLGKIAGSVGQFVFDVGTIIIGIPAFLATISFTAIIAPVVIFFFLGVLVYSLFQQNLLSSLVPPPQVNMGKCVLKTETETGSGIINCNKDAPENYFPGISKASFVSVANRWSQGENHAEECYNDVVNRALCAGINPAYALWAWVHESGASNYSLPEIEDFGIHGFVDVPAKNFSKQINKFLTLRPGNACPNLDYWLSFATNYLTGTCDPDYVNKVAGITGRDYLKEMQATWSWVSSEPMPPSIKTTPSGKDCGNTNDETTDNPNTFEYTDEEGKTWICEDDKDTVPGDFTGSMVPAEPIYDDSCLESPAYCVVKYLLSNGVQDITRANEKAVENLINQWKNAPASFNKSVFNSAMAVSTQYYDGFQCVGFAVGLTPVLGTRGWGSSHENWQAMIAHGSPECPRIEASGAGVGDFILFPTGSWYHIVVLSKLRPDGSFAISQANWGAPGRMSNVEGSNLQSYLNGKSVLRCK